MDSQIKSKVFFSKIISPEKLAELSKLLSGDFHQGKLGIKIDIDNKNEKNQAQEKSSSLDIKVNNESVHNESINVNKNVGSFDNDFDPSKDPISQIDNEILIEKSSNKLGSIREEDKKVDFEKFKKTKKRRAFKPAKNAFSIKLDT